jgi:hypothetical protein
MHELVGGPKKVVEITSSICYVRPLQQVTHNLTNNNSFQLDSSRPGHDHAARSRYRQRSPANCDDERPAISNIPLVKDRHALAEPDFYEESAKPLLQDQRILE